MGLNFGMLFLDSQHQLIRFKTLFTGTVNSAAVYPRELVRAVIACNAAAIILVHNHPSGDPTPSGADHHVTKRMKTACDAVGLEFTDHIVIGSSTNSSGQSYFSFREAGLL